MQRDPGLSPCGPGKSWDAQIVRVCQGMRSRVQRSLRMQHDRGLSPRGPCKSWEAQIARRRRRRRGREICFSLQHAMNTNAAAAEAAAAAAEAKAEVEVPRAAPSRPVVGLGSWWLRHTQHQQQK